MNEFVETLLELTWHEPKSSYDVVIVGGGGHGLSTAYHLAARHGITNVLVVEANYIGSGNSGRNTTIIRSNYGLAESIQFYDHSLRLYQQLEDETGCWIMHAGKGLIWLAHSEATLRSQRARALLNAAFDVQTEFLTPAEVKRLCPQIDLSGGGRYPVLGATHHVPGATARHDRVVWAYAQGAMRLGVHVLQQTPVIDLLRDGDRVVGVRTPAGDIAAGAVVSAVGGNVSELVKHAGLRLPIRTHPLQAFVTNAYERTFPNIISDTEMNSYISQTARGQMLIGHEYDQQASYSMQSSFQFLQQCSRKMAYVLPFTRDLRILRSWTGRCDISTDFSPIIGHTGVDGLFITTGWGTWGFKAIPAGGEQLAQLIATGEVPSLIRPFSLDRFARDHSMADLGSAGTK